MCAVCARHTRAKQVEYFWKQGDFGYIDERLKELTVMCEPKSPVRLCTRMSCNNLVILTAFNEKCFSAVD